MPCVRLLSIYCNIKVYSGWGGCGLSCWAPLWIVGIPGPQRQDVCSGDTASETVGGAGGGGRSLGGVGGDASLAMCQPLFISQANISKTHGGQEFSAIHHTVAPLFASPAL